MKTSTPNFMCGICGQLNFAKDEPVNPETIHRMSRSMFHRGPDDEGAFISGPVGLGFRRLSIIDLTGGRQPMSDAEGTVQVVFNGEIYNFRELRRDLESRGHKFRTRSDTEVIVHGYKQWGTGVFDRLNGMFGIAIWDVKQRRLIVARDAMGIKLIYYRIENGQLTFGSEIRPVLAAQNSKPEISPAAIALFLRFRYTPSPLTIFKGLRKLAAGTMLIVENGSCREERWYDFTPSPFPDTKKDSEAAEELLDLYRRSVRRHLCADVPVGVLLSGGLDSALLLALMNEHGRHWPAYTAGYGKAFADDELQTAALTALRLGARHVAVKLDQNEFERSLAKIIDYLEEPVASSSIVPMYFVCKRAREDVKVALIGQGPDELFGGYNRHLGVHYGNLWRRLPGAVRSRMSSAILRLPRNETLKRGVQSLAIEDRVARYESIFSLHPEQTVAGLFRPEFCPNGDSELSHYLEPIVPQMERTDELGGFQLLEIRSSLPDELLMYADKLSMAHNLEARVPYLDRPVVEFVQRLGANQKIRYGIRKWLHRRICFKMLPTSILFRKKRGFAVNVVDDWFDTRAKSMFSQMLLDEDSLIYEQLRPEPVRALLEQHRARRQDNHKLLFSLVMFEQWLRSMRSQQVNDFPSALAA
ncbi:MAG TPA: asparagine synthase (glutamine-hydrolyzing) [Alphaproteobacteria bacterium]|nr:asparagine synthase (glutamine-hydrolyzing) [Alphaproteobacteria bacterium]